jgi:hypothetical protein
MGVLATATDGEPAVLPDLGHHERQVEEAMDGVIADEACEKWAANGALIPMETACRCPWTLRSTASPR